MNCRSLVSALPSLRRGLMTATALLSLSACAPNPHEGQVYDPWESYNRAVFSFNEQVDRFVLKPIAQGYVAVVPEYGRQRVHNVLSNLMMPVVFVNSVFQGDPENAFSSMWSFVLNSTLGVAGVFDFAGTNTSIRVHDEDFGQTLAVWGVGSGPYFVLPVLGPSSIRDTGGFVVDIFTDPFNYLDRDIVITRTIVRAIDARAGLLDTIDDVYKTSFDPYATIRSGYFQRRAALIGNRNAPAGPGVGGGAGASPAEKRRAATIAPDPADQAEKEGMIPSTSAK